MKRNSKGLVSGEKLVSGDGIGDVGMSSSSKVPNLLVRFLRFERSEGFCEGSGDLVSQFSWQAYSFQD